MLDYYMLKTKTAVGAEMHRLIKAWSGIWPAATCSDQNGHQYRVQLCIGGTHFDDTREWCQMVY